MVLVASADTRAFFNDSNQKIVRCSTSWIPFRAGTMLCGLHTKEFCGPFPTIRSILVEVDATTFLPIRKTSVLCFSSNSHERIQFLSGLAADDMNIYLTLGVGDHSGVVERLPKTTVERMLA